MGGRINLTCFLCRDDRNLGLKPSHCSFCARERSVRVADSESAAVGVAGGRLPPDYQYGVVVLYFYRRSRGTEKPEHASVVCVVEDKDIRLVWH